MMLRLAADLVLGVPYPEGLTREAQLALGVAVLVTNVMLYLMIWRRRRRVAPLPGRGR